MKSTWLFSLLLSCALLTHAQAGKGNKALDSKDFKGAKAAFESALASDAQDAAAHLGLARYYAIPTNPEHNNDKAVESLVKAESIFKAADLKLQAKLEKDGVTALTLQERRDRIEAAILEDVKEVNTIAAYSDFLERFPNSSVARPAATYRDELAFKDATLSASEAGWNDFIRLYPKSEKMNEAITTRNKVAADFALKANSEEVYSAYIKNYPDAQQTPQMVQRLNAVAFENAKAKNSIKAYQDYISGYPESIFIMQAKERLDALKETEGND